MSSVFREIRKLTLSLNLVALISNYFALKIKVSFFLSRHGERKMPSAAEKKGVGDAIITLRHERLRDVAKKT